ILKQDIIYIWYYSYKYKKEVLNENRNKNIDIWATFSPSAFQEGIRGKEKCQQPVYRRAGQHG
ncbi:MAG: hypothetical protein JXB48_01575, partial [Candidatus Latescibacteria bacterium]|nr:hypothetical protein [Candidatus Latescibacterota bacterium]